MGDPWGLTNNYKKIIINYYMEGGMHGVSLPVLPFLALLLLPPPYCCCPAALLLLLLLSPLPHPPAAVVEPSLLLSPLPIIAVAASCSCCCCQLLPLLLVSLSYLPQACSDTCLQCLKFYVLLMCLPWLQCLQLDVSHWQTLPWSFVMLRALARKLRLCFGHHVQA